MEPAGEMGATGDRLSVSHTATRHAWHPRTDRWMVAPPSAPADRIFRDKNMFLSLFLSPKIGLPGAGDVDTPLRRRHTPRNVICHNPVAPDTPTDHPPHFWSGFSKIRTCSYFCNYSPKSGSRGPVVSTHPSAVATPPGMLFATIV